jgi:hypothetical protein
VCVKKPRSSTFKAETLSSRQAFANSVHSALFDTSACDTKTQLLLRSASCSPATMAELCAKIHALIETLEREIFYFDVVKYSPLAAGMFLCKWYLYVMCQLVCAVRVGSGCSWLKSCHDLSGVGLSARSLPARHFLNLNVCIHVEYYY